MNPTPIITEKSFYQLQVRFLGRPENAWWNATSRPDFCNLDLSIVQASLAKLRATTTSTSREFRIIHKRIVTETVVIEPKKVIERRSLLTGSWVTAPNCNTVLPEDVEALVAIFNRRTDSQWEYRIVESFAHAS